MQPSQLQRLFDEMYRANHELWKQVQELGDTGLTVGLGSPIGTLHSHLVGMIRNENLWINYLWHGEVEFLREASFPSLNHIRREWDALEAETRDYLSTLTTADLKQKVNLDILDLPSLSLGTLLRQIVENARESRQEIQSLIACLHCGVSL